jgi:hypothetical protein
MTCYLYAIGRLEGPVKVGVSSSVNGRLSSIQTGCPFQIRLIHAVKCDSRAQAFSYESAFHSALADERLSGEWFNLDGNRAYAEMNSLVDDIEAYKAELGK